MTVNQITLNLKHSLNLGIILGLVPLPKKWHLISKLYSIILMTLSTLIFANYCIFILEDTKNIQAVFVYINKFNYYSVGLICIVSSQRINLWNSLLENLNLINKEFKMKNRAIMSLPLVIMCLGSIIIVLFKIHSIISVKLPISLMFLYGFTEIRVFVVCSIITHISLILYKVIRFLNTKLEAILTTKFRSSKQIRNELKRIVHIYKLCSHISCDMDMIFGWIIFMYIPLSSTWMLVAFSHVTYFKPTTGEIVIFLLVSCILMVSLIKKKTFL